jgi:hypothetical protein
MIAGPILVALAISVTLLVTAIVVSVRDSPSGVRDELGLDRGPPDEHVDEALVGFGVIGGQHRDDEPIFTVFEPNQLLAVDHLRGMEAADELLQHVAQDVRGVRRSPRRRPRRPTSILFHGPPGGAMTILSHELARGFHARLVQLFASRALPSTNGGVQPKVAVAVNQARDRMPSVLLIDQLEHVAAASVRDADRQRTANDLLSEALRPIYGTSHVVIGIFTMYDNHKVPRRLTDVFEHVVPVDLRELERALRTYALRTGDRELFRAISGPCLAEHPDVAPPRWHTAA